MKLRWKECWTCKGSGEVWNAFGDDNEYLYTECSKCNGVGKTKPTLGDLTKDIKYSDVIQPVRALAMENSVLRLKLRSYVKQARKVRYKRNKLAKSVKKQGLYIQWLKAKVALLEEQND